MDEYRAFSFKNENYVVSVSSEIFTIQSGVDFYEDVKVSDLLVAQEEENYGTEKSPWYELNWYEFKYGWFLRFIDDSFLVGKYVDGVFKIVYI